MFWFGNEKKGKALGSFSLTPGPIAKEGEGNKASPRPLSKERGVECLGNGGQKGRNLGASVEKV